MRRAQHRHRRRWSVLIGACVTLGATLGVATSAEAADPVAADFKQNCSSCHTIGGGKLTGPDLKDVGSRRDADWLQRFIVDPGGMIDSGDAAAVKLLAEYNNVRMPPIAGMDKDRAAALLELISRESKLEKSQFAGVQISSRPFTQDDIDLGRELFVGTVPLAAGGASCVSCHHAGDLPGAGGGRLGPDLTKVYERYGSRKKLGAWLTAPATETMLPTFKDHPIDIDREVLPLVAYFESLSKNAQEKPSTAGMAVFFLLAVLGTGLALAIGGRLWGFRFRAVRRPLIEGASARGRKSHQHAGNES